MERTPRVPHTTISLSKQESIVDCDEGIHEGGDLDEILSPETTMPKVHMPPSPPSQEIHSDSALSSNFCSIHKTGPPHGPGPGGGMTNGSVEPSLGDNFNIEIGRSNSLERSQQRSLDSDKDPPLVTSARQRHNGGKLKQLQRSHAMRDDTSPPPELMDTPPSTCSSSHNYCSHNSNTLTVSSGGGGRRRLRHQGSSQGSFEESSPCLSRDSSMEYTDSSGVDLQQFIIQTLHKNQKDRMMLLKIEQELVSLVKDNKRTHHKFQSMSSYQRMLVHRCGAFFGLEHNVDQAGTSVIVNKTRNTRLPEVRFRDHCRDELLPPDEPKRSILKRDSGSFDDGSIYYKSLSSTDGLCDSPLRSHDSTRRNSQDELRWQDTRYWSFGETEGSHRKHHFDNHRLRPGRLPKVESFESRDTLHPRSLRPPVFKSHSFGGYSGGVTVLSRGESVSSNISSCRLSKQDSTSSRMSEHSSSSGYKTHRQDTSSTNVSNTLSTTPSPTTGQQQHSSQSAGMWGGEIESQTVMWAVTDIDAVPPGAMLIHPQSGQPYVNPDGTVYRYDPHNPPALSDVPMDEVEHIEKDKDKLDEYDTSSESNESLGTCFRDGANQPTAPLSPKVLPTTKSSLPLVVSSNGTSPTLKIQEIKLSEILRDNNGNEGDVDEVSEPNPNTAVALIATGGDVLTQPPHQVVYPQFFHHPSLDHRQYSQQESCGSDVVGPMRGMSLSTSNSVDVEQNAHVPSSSLPQGYVVHRQQFAQPVYYMPACSMSGTVKYVYPQYQTALSSAQPCTVTSMQVGVVPNVPQPSGPAPTMDTSHHISPPGGYIPGGYTMVSYPGGVGSGAQEAGGTTYYCQLPPSVPQIPNQQPTPGTSFQHYTYVPVSTASSYPQQLGLGNGVSYYSGNGMSGNNLYPNTGATIYGVSSQGSNVNGSTVSFRAPTPPHTPSNQGMSIGLGFVSGNNGAIGGQYMAMGPPQPPTTHAAAPPQLFTTFFRPSVQMLGGTTGTPPPQQMLQYSGVGSVHPGAVTPHPPVYAKPYGSANIHTIVQEPPLIKDDGKRLITMAPSQIAAGSLSANIMTTNIAAGPTVHHTHLIPRPYSIIQSDIRMLGGGGNTSHNMNNGSITGGGSGPMRRATLVTPSRPCHTSSFTYSSLPLNPLGLSRPPKVRKQKSRTSYVRVSEPITPQMSVEVEGPELV